MSTTLLETIELRALEAPRIESPQSKRSNGALPNIEAAASSTNSPPPDHTNPEEPQHSMLQIATIMTCLCACVFISALDITIVTTALPTISSYFDSPSSYTWIGTSFTLAHTASTPIWGKLSDIWGRRSIVLISNAIFFGGSLMCALVEGIDAFIAGRALQGLGAGGMQTVVNIAIGDLFSQRDRGFWYGLTSVVWALASGVGPVMGGIFTTNLTWRWCFWINLPMTGLVFPLLYFSLHLPSPHTPILAGLKAIDWSGSALIISGALMLLIGLHLGGVHSPWDSPVVICLIIFGVVAGTLFVLNEWKLATYPVMPMHLFKTVSSSAAYAVCFFHAFAFMGVAYYLPLYFQSVLLASPLMSGLYLLPFILSSSIVAALTGWYIQWSGKYLPAIYTGLSLMTLGIGLLIDLPMDADWSRLVCFQIIGGSGFGMNLEGPLLAVQAAVRPTDVAAATAAMSFVRTISTAISIVIGGVVFQNEMGKRMGLLVNELGPDLATLFNGENAIANIEIIKSLPAGQRQLVREAFFKSTRSMWIVYVAFSAAGLLIGFLVKGHQLKTEHVVIRTGLDTMVSRQERNAEPQ